MSFLVILDAEGRAQVRGEAPPRPAPVPAKVANAGHGDVRKKIVPVVRAPAGPSATEWEGGHYVSLAQWIAAPEVGGAVLLQPTDDIRGVADRFNDAALVAVDFHRINDGRGYTHAFLLRERLGYRGPLRAIGAVTADQVYALARAGFDSFALRADQDAHVAIAALGTFSEPYQSSAHAPGALASRDAANFRARLRLLERALSEISSRHERPALASSLSAEDMIITDVIARLGLRIDVFTLDTGRLHAETVALIGVVETRYGLRVEVVRPNEGLVSSYVSANGADAFYEGVELRKVCCHIRKVEPLGRALQGRDAWLTGQRREQAVTRSALVEAEHDAAHDAQKYNPLADWSWADVLTYAALFDIPMSTLYARGYVSIGCEPCTKAIRPGDDPRTGRWWWENQDNKECGLHSATVR